MLTRLYIDNFRCFSDFKLSLGRKNLIFGRNGTGKSSFLDVLNTLREFAVEGAELRDILDYRSLTRWTDTPIQKFALDVEIAQGHYQYELIVEHGQGRDYPAVRSELLSCNATPIVALEDGIARQFESNGSEKSQFRFPQNRSIVATYFNIGGDRHAFKWWLSDLHGTRVNPIRMRARSEQESTHLDFDCSNFADWYRHFVQENPDANEALRDALVSAIEGFERLVPSEAGQGVRVLNAELRSPFGVKRMSFEELSDGQRVLVALYTLLIAGAHSGHTVVIDEPDNFIALPEIQPWLLELLESVDLGKGQAILISHHPELLNQMASDCGIVFTRDDAGPVRVRPYKPSGAGAISPAEDVARGWFDE